MSALEARRAIGVAAFICRLRLEAVEHMVDRARREPSREHFAAAEWHARGLARFAREQAAGLEAIRDGRGSHA